MGLLLGTSCGDEKVRERGGRRKGMIGRRRNGRKERVTRTINVLSVTS